MKALKEYIKDHLGTFFSFLLLFACLAGVFYLYGFPMSALAYTAAVSLVILFFLIFLPSFFSYIKKRKSLHLLQKTILSTLEPIPFASTSSEKTLCEVLDSLCLEIRTLQQEGEFRKEDMMSYYTLWVHQIKTPISAMRLILQSEENSASAALRQELFKIERYVEMVLGYLRLHTMSADLHLASCTAGDIVRQAVKKFAPMFIYQKLSLQLDEFTNKIITDEKWLLFVLEQLLSNALKYTKEGSITISMDENDVLLIQDTGMGIKSEDLPRIFERGFTGQNGRLERTSTGLGLYLTKQVLKRLQNHIEVSSTPGKGTAVRLYLHRTEYQKD